MNKDDERIKKAFAPTRMDIVKHHFRKYQTIYMFAGGIVLGAVSGVLLSRVILKNAGFVIHANDNQGVINVARQIVIEAAGNSGNVIKDLTTGIVYPSQNAAAKALGLDPSMLSKHLSGRDSHIMGHVFEKLIDGSAPHTLVSP